MSASPTFLFADAVLKRYKKQWWCPFTGSNPMSGFAATTPRSTAVKKYMESLEDWTRLRGNLIAKAFQDGGPFPVFDQHDGNPKLKEPVLCFTCKEMTMAYGEKNTVFNRVEGPDEIDRCDVCLSPNPPKDTDGRREESGRGGEGATGEIAWVPFGVGRSADGLHRRTGAPMAVCGDLRLSGGWVADGAVRPGVEWLAAGPRRG